MTLRYDRETSAAVNLTGGGLYIRFPEGVYEIDLHPDVERKAAEQYDRLELIEDDDGFDFEDADSPVEEAEEAEDEFESDSPVEVAEADGDEDDEYEADPVPEDEDGDEEDEVERCGVEKVNGEACDRPADDCLSHGVPIREDSDSEG